MKLQPDIDPADVATKLWEGARLIIKRLHTDKRVRFGTYSGWQATTVDPELTDHQALVSASVGVSQYSIRKYTAMFGTVNDVGPWAGRPRADQSIYLVQYQHRESAAISAGMVFDTASGQISFTTLPCDFLQEVLRQQTLATVGDEAATDDDTWRLHAGLQWGAAAAMQSAAQWLCADLLHQAATTTTPPSAPTTAAAPTLDDVLGPAITLHSPARAERPSRQEHPDSRTSPY